MIPFAKPSVNLTRAELRRIHEICLSGQFCEGRYVEKLETYFKRRFRVRYAIACASCTSGLVIAIKAAGIKNMKVYLPAFTWPSTLYALECNNNIPWYGDIDPKTWCLKKPVNAVDAIVSVDTFGNRSYIKTKLPIIYDAAHGFGIKGLGRRGLAEVVSFSFTKPITAMQGGMILTNNSDICEKAMELRRLSAKMCEINALVGLNEIERDEEKFETRKDLIVKYRRHLKIPFKEQKVKHGNYSTYSILIENRDKVKEALRQEGFETKVYYKPLVNGLKNTDLVYSKIISLPLREEIKYKIPKICNIINGLQ